MNLASDQQTKKHPTGLIHIYCIPLLLYKRLMLTSQDSLLQNIYRLPIGLYSLNPITGSSMTESQCLDCTVRLKINKDTCCPVPTPFSLPEGPFGIPKGTRSADK